MRIGGAPGYVQRPMIEPKGPGPNGSGEARAPVVTREAASGEDSRPRHDLPRHFALRRALSAYLIVATPSDPAEAAIGPRIAEAV